MRPTELTTAFALAGLCLLASCAPAQVARLDMAASGGIVWPGQPEKPRIKYLWSLHNLSPEAEGGRRDLGDVLSGRTRDDAADPQTADYLIRPQGVFADGVRYYIADPGASRVTVIDRKTMEVIQLTEADGESLEYPRSVAADSSGTIYVSDSERRKVFVFSPDGKYRSAFGGELARPEGIAVDRNRGIVYVVDTDAHSVVMFGTDGTAKGRFGELGSGPGQFHYPTYAAVDREGRVYVTDFMNFRIQVFSPGGVYQNSIGSLGDSYDALDKPKGVAVDSEGHVYVVDGARHMVKIFSVEGRLLLFFGEKGEGYGDLYLPAGIFIDDKDVIYVADSLNMRIQAFQFLGGS